MLSHLFCSLYLAGFARYHLQDFCGLFVVAVVAAVDVAVVSSQQSVVDREREGMLVHREACVSSINKSQRC